MKHGLFLMFALLIACGGSSTPAASPSSTTGGETGAENKEGHHGNGHSGKGGHHEGLSPALNDFHGVIAPVWHAPAGKERIEKACSNSKALVEKAQATGDAELVAAAGAIDPACAKDGRPDVEAKLSAVHDRFHALAKMAKHDEKHDEKH